MNPHKQLASAVVENIKKLPSFRKIPVNRLWLFANDLSLVVLGIRTGYLLDAFAVPNPVDTFTCLINQLRMHRPEFSFIVHIYEPASDQSFFVNSHLFQRMHQCSSFSVSLQQDQSCCPDYTSFVLLSESPALLSNPPDDLQESINNLCDAIASTRGPSISLPDGLTQQIVIPMAAFLLEYPVAYIPPLFDQATSLSSTSLTVYEGSLHFASQGTQPSYQHTVIKFSCPTALTSQHRLLSPDDLQDRVTAHFRSRIAEAGLSPSTLFMVERSIQMHDRVGL